MTEYDLAQLIDLIRTNLSVAETVTTLKADVAWLKWGIFLLYPLVIGTYFKKGR